MRGGEGRAALLTTDQHGNYGLRRSAAKGRPQLAHPLIASDGHLLEPTELLHDYLTALVGTNTARRILLRAGRQVSMGNSSTRHPRTGWRLTPGHRRDI